MNYLQKINQGGAAPRKSVPTEIEEKPKDLLLKNWKMIGENINEYKTYPRIVGETGGKDFCIAHESSDIDTLVTAMIRGAFEYQGQKCSAMSRAYIPTTIWGKVKNKYLSELKTIKIGSADMSICL